MEAVRNIDFEDGLAERYRLGMRQLAASVSLVTTGAGDDRRGLTATSVCSVSADPPTLLVCVNRTAGAHDFLSSSGTFCINVLSTEDLGLCENFAAKDGMKGLQRFETGDWLNRPTAPPILKTALAVFDCVTEQQLFVNTHTIFIARVIGAHVSSESNALIYHQRSFRTLAEIAAPPQ